MVKAASSNTGYSGEGSPVSKIFRVARPTNTVGLTEDKDPADPRPVEQNILFLLRAHCREGLFIKRAGRRCILNEQQEQRAKTERLVEIANRINVLRALVAVHLEEGDESIKDHAEDDSDDLSLFLRTPIPPQVEDDE